MQLIAAPIWEDVATSGLVITSTRQGLYQVDWVTAEYVSDDLKALLATLWPEFHTLVVDLISLVHHNTRECLGVGIYSHEFYLLPILQPQNFVYQS